uniref:Uncharacterized protein n=1 Tax=Fagus sylvatica TaxID=28930 RepID=A0A2N9EGN6_FAGSY
MQPTIGIAVDHRRKESFFGGSSRLMCRRLVDSAPEELASATQVQAHTCLLAREKPSFELVKVTEEMKSFKAYDKLRLEQTNQHHVGVRQKRAAEAEKEEKM